MITSLQIHNFKSVRNLELELGRINVLIGANGSGKSNLLEAIALASGAASGKLDSEFLSTRGLRIPQDIRMLFSAFDADISGHFRLDVSFGRETLGFGVGMKSVFADSQLVIDYVQLPGSKRRITQSDRLNFFESHLQFLKGLLKDEKDPDKQSLIEKNINEIKPLSKSGNFFYIPEIAVPLIHFLIYAPEYRALRAFTEETQISPLGIRGEGLFHLLKILAQRDNGSKLEMLKERLELIDWFEDFEFQKDPMPYERRLLIRDRHLSGDLAYFDQRSANEGFLFLLFYFCLFLSDATPPFFAIDNIDSSLNPKLCTRLMQELVQLAKDNGKQVILTTHNPAILDGLDLNDDEQRLYTVRRNLDGETIVDRICAPKVSEGQIPVRLSDAYLRGLLGGLPNNF